MHHEPCRLLSDAEIAAYFVAADAVLAIDQKPYRRKPFFERNGRVLENSADFEGELLAWVLLVASVQASLAEIGEVLRATFGTADLAIRPANGDHELAAVLKVAKVLNRLLESGGRFHTTKVAELP